MYKKSYFRGLGTGLVIGALTMTVAFNFGTAGKTDSGQGKTAVVSQQQDKSTEDSSTETTTEKKTEDKTTEKTTTQKVTTEKNANADKTTTETGKSENGKSDAESGSGSNSGTTGSSDKSNGTGTTDNNGGLSDKTERVPSAKDNGYTEDKNSQTGSGSNTNKTTEAAEAVKASAIKYDNGGGEITFGSGTSAYEICQLLAQIGIRDADEYYDWLLRSGYSGSLVPGTYTFTGNETNGGIVWILLGNQ